MTKLYVTNFNTLCEVLCWFEEDNPLQIGLPDGDGYVAIAIQKLVMYGHTVVVIGDADGTVVRAYWLDDYHPIVCELSEEVERETYRTIIWTYLNDCVHDEGTVFCMADEFYELLEDEEIGEKFDQDKMEQVLQALGKKRCYLLLEEED
ncbi:MAG: hypothetical protein Q4G52_02615 [Clostridia bacterium]|nr:hypothetical protein [Clostridia bacterium]